MIEIKFVAHLCEEHQDVIPKNFDVCVTDADKDATPRATCSFENKLLVCNAPAVKKLLVWRLAKRDCVQKAAATKGGGKL